MTSNNDFTFFRKKQTAKNDSDFNGENYFLKPSLNIVLNKPTIQEITSKYIIFKCIKEDQIKLSQLSDIILEKFKNNFTIHNENDTVNPLINKNFIRCILANNSYSSNKGYSNFNYNIQFYINDIPCKFTSNKINKNTKIDKVIVNIKNIWYQSNKYGFNCIIDEMYIQ